MVVALIGTLMALLLPALGAAMGSARSFKCQMGLRNVAYDFGLFADTRFHSDRGDDESLSNERFRLETFQESQYCIDEFWCWGEADVAEIPNAQGNDPMRCPEVRGPLTLRANAPCTGGGVGPFENVSYTFNIRMHVAERRSATGPLFRRVELTESVLGGSDVPLVWDVDGELARGKGQQPFFSGPSLDSRVVFANDRYWFPGSRHARNANFAFMDAHVETTRDALSESGWRFGFVPAGY